MIPQARTELIHTGKVAVSGGKSAGGWCCCDSTPIRTSGEGTTTVSEFRHIQLQPTDFAQWLGMPSVRRVARRPRDMQFHTKPQSRSLPDNLEGKDLGLCQEGGLFPGDDLVGLSKRGVCPENGARHSHSDCSAEACVCIGPSERNTGLAA